MSWLALAAAIALIPLALAIPSLSLKAACKVTQTEVPGFWHALFLVIVNSLLATFAGVVFGATIGLALSLAIGASVATWVGAIFAWLVSGGAYSGMLNVPFTKGLAITLLQSAIAAGAGYVVWTLIGFLV